MTIFRFFFAAAILMALASCISPQQAPPSGERPMDEVPVQSRMPNGDRAYGFKNGCVVVLEPKRAVVRTESSICALHHRDIALLYASAD